MTGIEPRTVATPGSNPTRIPLDERRELVITVVPSAARPTLRVREFYRVGPSRPLQPAFGALEIPADLARAVAAALGQAAKGALVAGG